MTYGRINLCCVVAAAAALRRQYNSLSASETQLLPWPSRRAKRHEVTNGRLYSSLVQVTVHKIIISTKFENHTFDVNPQPPSVAPLLSGSKSLGPTSPCLFHLFPSPEPSASASASRHS